MLPTETLLEVLFCLDRFDFDAIELSSRFFRHLLAASTDRLALRSIRRCIWDFNDLSIYASAPYADREIAHHSYAAKIIPLLVTGLRDCYVQELVLESVDTDALNVLPSTLTGISGDTRIFRLVLRCMDFADTKVDNLFRILAAFRHVEYVEIDGM
ncbi:hypothetical protein AAVH_30421 [Aphelenchoides avenae]|nr:hypothetical protein AAVH_30421 [Aphelenchus avenae]